MYYRKLPSGNWQALVYYQEDGKGRYKSFSAKTKAEAHRKAVEWESTQTIADKRGDTIKDAMKVYIESKNNILSPSTILEYTNMSKRAFKSIESYRLDSISKTKLQQWINDYSQDHSPKSVRNVEGFLSAVYKANGFQFPDLTLPMKRKTNYHIVTDDEVKKLIQATKGTKLGIAIQLAAFIPARRSEICALEFSDVDAVRNTITINKAMVKNEHSYAIKGTKTTESTRTVIMPKDIIEEIGTGTGRIFAEYNPRTLYAAFSKKLKELGMSFRFHDLRHYGATFLHLQNIPDKYVMERGGWSNVGTLQGIYTHTLQQGTEDAAKKVDEKFSSFFA